MTRIEAIKILSCRDNRGCPIVWQDGFIDTVDMAIEALKFQEVYDVTIKAVNEYYDKHHTVSMNWIPCDEELPKKEEDVLVTNNWHEVRMAYLTDRTNGKVLCWIVDHNSYHPVGRNEILAWMPLPTPFFDPTQQQEGETE